jgi:hypothetical protein
MLRAGGRDALSPHEKLYTPRMRRLAIAVVVILAACTPEKPATETVAKKQRPPAPTAAEAETLIKESMEFGELDFTNAGWTTSVSGARMSPPVKAEAQQLAAAGWVAFDGAGDLMLTEKGRNDRRFLMRPNGILDVVPLAKKEFGQITAVRDRDGEVTADFTWRWIPNEVGAALTSGPAHDRYAAPQNGTATLIHDGTNWTILKVVKR